MFTDVVFDYFVSRKLQKEEAIRDGVAGKTQRTLRVALADLTQEQREALVPVCSIQSSYGYFYADLRERRERREPSYPTSASAYWETQRVYLDAEPTAAEAVEMAVEIASSSREIEEWARAQYDDRLAARAAREEADEAAYQAAVAELEPLLAGDNIEALRAFNLEQRGVTGRNANYLAPKIAERIRQLERETAEAPMREWITAHGSPRLQKALAAGVDVERPYLQERVATSLPGFRLDWGDDATLDDGYPSEDALDEAEALRSQGHNAEALICTSWPDEDGYDQCNPYNDGSAEAIAIWQVYGSKHRAIKVLS